MELAKRYSAICVMAASIFSSGCDSQSGPRGTPVDKTPPENASEVVVISENINYLAISDTTLWMDGPEYFQFDPRAYFSHRSGALLSFDLTVVEGSSIEVLNSTTYLSAAILSPGDTRIRIKAFSPSRVDSAVVIRTFSVVDYCENASVSDLNPYLSFRQGSSYVYSENRSNYDYNGSVEFRGQVTVSVLRERCLPKRFSFDVVEHFEGTRVSSIPGYETGPDGEPAVRTDTVTYTVEPDTVKLGIFTSFLDELPWNTEVTVGDTLYIERSIGAGIGGPGDAEYTIVLNKGIVRFSAYSGGRWGSRLALHSLD